MYACYVDYTERVMKELFERNECMEEIKVRTPYEIEICEVCGKEILPETGDQFLDKSCGYKFWLCDECIDERDMY
mgnify:CR=1 FL=1